MKTYEPILEELVENANVDFSLLGEKKKYDKFLDHCWEIIRKGDTKNIEHLVAKLGEDKYRKLEEYIKEQNAEYYSLDYFRNTDIEVEVRKALLLKIYANAVVISDYQRVLEWVKGKITRTQLDDIMKLLQSITDFCASYNRSGKYFVEVLEKTYDIVPSVCYDLQQLFDENRISLKLDYLINYIENVFSSKHKD